MSFIYNFGNISVYANNASLAHNQKICIFYCNSSISDVTLQKWNS